MDDEKAGMMYRNHKKTQELTVKHEKVQNKEFAVYHVL